MQQTEFLDGVRILTIAQNVPGPLAVARLRQAGAHVTKIEPPTGDPLLTLSSAWHAELHVGMAIERIDLKSDVGHERAMTLLRNVDVFITSQRPSLLARLRLDPETLRSRIPALRYLRILGSIQDPERPGHDLTYQAQCGLLGEEMPRTLVADVMASERAFAGTLALLRRPPGSVMDVGLVESLEPLLASLRHGLTMPNGPLGGGAPQYRIYTAMAGRIAIAALEPHFETRLYQELGRPTRTDLSSCFLERTADQWEAWARERDLPIVAVRDVDRENGPSTR
jgi:crotonobetainyl-CoA:carnitine CoA-transferase CaiB-like acyl-CoA transferase